MRARTFYLALIPPAIAAIFAGYVSKCEQPEEVEQPPKQAQIECKTIDSVAQTVVQEYAQKYSLAPHVATYLTQNMCNALLVEQQWNIPAAGVLAKAGSEHSFGKQDEKIKKGNNHFGIKWTEQYAAKFPNCFDAKTWEFNPRNKTEACFVSYENAQQSYLHFGEFLATRQIGSERPYEEVMNNLDNPVSFLTALAHSKYSSDTAELPLTLGVLHENHLEEIVSAVKERANASAQPKEAPKLQKEKETSTMQKVLGTTALYTVRAYSQEFKQGDFILLEFESAASCKDTSFLFAYKNEKNRKMTAKIPVFEYNQKLYGQTGTDFEYPAQEATVSLQTTCTDSTGTTRTIKDQYPLKIKAREFESESLTITPGQKTKVTEAQKKARTEFYKSWKPTYAEAYITQGYQNPIEKEFCHPESFGVKRTWGNGSTSRHKGVDCSAKLNDPVYALLGGVITYAQDIALPAEGVATTINHGYGLSSVYMHQSSHAINSGIIEPGTIHGYIGSTGTSTGPHLHIQTNLQLGSDIIHVNPLSLCIANEVFR